MRPRCNIHNNEITDIFPKDDKDQITSVNVLQVIYIDEYKNH